MRSFGFLGTCLFATMTVSACGGSSQQQGGDDAGNRTDTSDVVDAIELDASASCSSITCGPGEICVHERGGIPDASLDDNCYPIPPGCGGVPTCACVSGLAASFICGMSCSQIGDREFMCMGA